MRQVENNAKLNTLNAPNVDTVNSYPQVRAPARARLIAPAQPRASRRASLLLSWRVATRAPGA